MLNINIENEYSRLKTVILGIADNLGNPPSESDAFDPRSLYHIKNNSYPLEEDLKKEVESFKKKLTKHNVEVLRPNNINDCNQIFARDLGFVISNMFFLSNIVPNRQDEIEGIKEILNHLNVGVIKLPEFMHIEGGDIIVHNDKVFIGTYSEEDYPSLITARTNNESIDYLNQLHFNANVRFYDSSDDSYLNYKYGDSYPIYARLSRFQLSDDLSHIIPSSEQVLIQQADRDVNHNAGDMFFDKEGFLVLSIGDEGKWNNWYKNTNRYNTPTSGNIWSN